MASPTPTGLPCLATLKFGGAIYLDSDHCIPATELGPVAGVTDPNPAHCGVPGGATVYHHLGKPATEEVVYRAGQRLEVFSAAGNAGFPLQGLLPWLVLVLVLLILAFAALPAVIGHIRNPPIIVGDDEPESGEGGGQ